MKLKTAFACAALLLCTAAPFCAAASISLQPTASTVSVGDVFSLDIQDVVVPLPASVWLLLGALGTLYNVTGRRR